MSLKLFHILFIVISTLLAFLFGAWGIGRHMDSSSPLLLGLGLVSMAFGVMLIVYGIWFYRKIRNGRL